MRTLDEIITYYNDLRVLDVFEQDNWFHEVGTVLAALDASRREVAGWIDVRTDLPPMDEVVEVAEIRGDGSLSRAFMCRFDSDDGWLWSRASGRDLTEADDDDAYCVAFWRNPTALPPVTFAPHLYREGRPTPYAEVNDPHAEVNDPLIERGDEPAAERRGSDGNG